MSLEQTFTFCLKSENLHEIKQAIHGQIFCKCDLPCNICTSVSRSMKHSYHLIGIPAPFSDSDHLVQLSNKSPQTALHSVIQSLFS